MTGLTLPARRHPARHRAALLATSALTLLAAQGAWTPALANPSGGTVTQGGATITTAPDTVTIEQTTDRAVIDWQDFSVDGGETTRFVQPDASSVTLNRVTGDNASVINGTITANGNVFLINRNGVLVGSDATIDVGGLVATTSDIDDGAFMAGGGRFDTPTDNPAATVVNQGTITVADHGIAALVGPTVENDGVIAARLGTVALGSAETFTVDLAGDGLISFDTGQPVARDAGTPQVSNAGTISAAGGTVILSAGQAAAVVDKAIDMTGVVTATAISAEGGVIVLSGGEGEVSVDGTLDVSGPTAGTSGGTIEVTGKTVSLGATASLDASGAAGGGTIRVGGGLKGTGTTPRAKTTSIAEGARLDASAREKGDGGLIVVWSDQKTTFGGTVLATGGTNGGDGGLIETSSAGVLDFGDFTIDASAPAGAGGEWLIDPGDVFVLEEEAGNLPSNPFDPSNDATFIFVDSIAAVLATGTDVTINTGSAGDGLSGTGEIGWEASTLPFAIGGDGSATLTLNALAGISWTGNLIASAGDLAVVLNAGEAISFGTGAIDATTIEVNGCLTSATCGFPVGSGTDDFSGISLSPGGSGSVLDLTADVVALRAGGGGLFVGDGTTIDAASSLILQGRGDQAFTFQAGSIISTQPGSTVSFQPTFANSDLVFIARDVRDFSNDNIDQDDLAALSAFDTIEFVTGAAFATFAANDGSASDASIGFAGGFAGATLDLPNNLLLDANDGGSVFIDSSLTLSVGGAASFQADTLIEIANGLVAGADVNLEAPDILLGADLASTGAGLALRGNVTAANSMLFSASTDLLIDGNLDGTAGTPSPIPPAIEMRTKSGTITVTGDSGGSFPLASLIADSPVSIEIGSITTTGGQTLDAPVTTLTGLLYDAGGFFQVSDTTLIANTTSVTGTGGVLFGGDVLRAPGALEATLTAVSGPSTDLDIVGVAGTAAAPLDFLDLTAGNALSILGAVTTGDQRFAGVTALFGAGTYSSSLGGFSAAGVTTSLLDGTMVVEAAGDVAFGAVDAFSPGAGLRITSRGGRALLDGPLGLGAVLDFLTVTAATSVEIGDATIENDLVLDAPAITFLGATYDVGGLFTATGNIILSGPTTITADDGVGFDGRIDLSGAAPDDAALSITSSGGAVAVLGAIGEFSFVGAITLASPLAITSGGAMGSGAVTLTAPVSTLSGDFRAGGPFQVSGQTLIAGNVRVDTDNLGDASFGGDVLRAPGAVQAGLTVFAPEADLDILGVAGTDVAPLDFLDFSATRISLRTTVTTGDQHFDALFATLGAGDYTSTRGSFLAQDIASARLDGTVTVRAAGDVSFTGVDALNPGLGTLNITAIGGGILFNGAIGGSDALATMTATAATDIRIGAATILNDLTLDAPAITLLDTTYDVGGLFTATGDILLSDPTTITADGGVRFDGGIDLSVIAPPDSALSIASSGGAITVRGAIGANLAPGAISLTSPLSIATGGIIGTGTVTQTAPLVTLSGTFGAGGDFDVGGAAVISGPVVIDATGAIRFSGTVEGSGDPEGDSLTVDAGQSILMTGTIGQGTSLSALRLTAGTTIGITGADIDGDILLSAGGGTDLSGDYDSVAGGFTLTGGARVSGPVRISVQNDVSFGGPIVSSGAGALVVDSALGTIAASGPITLDSVNFDAGDAIRVAAVTSAGAISLLAATTLDIAGDITAGTGVGLGGTVRFATDSTVTGPIGIEVAGTIDSALPDAPASVILTSSAGPIGVSGAIGSVTPLQNLQIVAESSLVALGDVSVAGDFLLAGTSVLLIGATYDAGGAMTVDGPVSLTASTRFTAGSDLRFTDRIDGLSPGSISLFLGSGGGDVELRGAVGTALALPLADLEVEAASRILIGNGVSTAGGQRYTAGTEIRISRGALDSTSGDILVDGPLVVTRPVEITSGGDVTITSTIDAIESEGGPSGSLDIVAAGALAVLGAVGQDTPLLAFALTAGTEIDPPSVTTFGPQSYTAPVIFLTGTDYLTNGGSFTTTGELRLTAPTVLIDTEFLSITAAGSSGPILLDGLAIGNAVTLNAGDSDITATDVRFASLDVLGTLGSADMGGTIGGIGDVQAAARVGRPSVVATYLFNGCIMATTCGGPPTDKPVRITLPDLIPAETDATAPPNVIFADSFDVVDDPRFVFSNTGKDALWRLDLTFPATGEENDQ